MPNPDFSHTSKQLYFSHTSTQLYFSQIFMQLYFFHTSKQLHLYGNSSELEQFVRAKRTFFIFLNILTILSYSYYGIYKILLNVPDSIFAANPSERCSPVCSCLLPVGFLALTFPPLFTISMYIHVLAFN